MTATKRKPKPITANPLFPFVTALWSATFLGLGSFAVAPALLEGPVVALGVPALVPAAAPPLGFTARVIFALAMLGVGAIAGYLIGRLLGREKVEAPVRMRGLGKSADEAATFEVCRPINAVEDLGEPLDAPVTDEAPLRRRALSLKEESPFAAPSQSAPLPGGMPWERAPVPESEAVLLEAVPAETMLPQSMAVVDPLALDLLLEEANAAGYEPFTPAQQDISEDQPDAGLAFAADLDWRDPAESGTESIASSGVADEPLFVPDAEPSYLLQAHAVAATPIDRAPLDTLGLVQLIERLALAISRRTKGAESIERAAPAEFVPAEFMVVAPPPPPAIARFESSSVDAPGAVADFDETEEWKQAEPEHVQRVVQLRPSAPLSARPIDLTAPDIDDEDDDEDLGLDRFLRMSPVVTRNRAPVVGRADGDPADGEIGPEPEVVEDRYPSLLDMGAVVARREPLRIDDSVNEALDDETGIEPVVVFPGHESPLQAGPLQAGPVQSGQARPFERPSIMPLPGSPLASPGRAAPSSPVSSIDDVDMVAAPASLPDAEEADRALRAALATLQRMTAQG